MSDRQIDLILALVEGSLPAAEAAAAEASLDDDARAELAAQRAARSALSEMGVPALTDTERSTMRAAVRNELNVQERPAQAPESPKAPWLVRALPALGAAAALVFVVGIGLSTLGGQNDAETADTETAALDEDTETTDAASLAGTAEQGLTTAAATAATAATTMAAEPPAADASADQPGTEEAFANRMMIPDNLGDISAVDLDALAAVVDEGSLRIIDYTPLAYSQLPAAVSDPGLICWMVVLDQVSELAEVDYFGIATLDGELVEVYRAIDGDSVIVFVIDRAECAVRALVEE